MNTTQNNYNKLLSFSRRHNTSEESGVLTPPLTDFLDYMDSEHLGDRSKQFLISYYNLLQLLNTSHPYISSKITRSISAPRPQEPTAIDILPDEILLYIFSLIVPDTAPELLCAVSHHWNSLVKSSTLLWTQIVLNNTKPTPGYVERRLELSKEAPLDIQLPLLIEEFGEPNPLWGAYLPKILNHSHRWKRLCIDLAYDLGEDEDDLEFTANCDEFQPMVFNAVEELYIGEYQERYSWSINYHLDAALSFYQNWKFPNVRTLSAEMHIPEPGAFPRLTCCSLDFSLHEYPRLFETGEDGLLRLKDFLGSCPELVKLTIEIGEYDIDFEDDDTEVPATPPVRLESVKEFRLESRSSNPDTLLVARKIMRSLELVAVERAEFFICLESLDLPDQTTSSVESGDNGSGELAWFRSLFPRESADSFKNLRSLRLERLVNSDADFGPLLRRFPTIRELCIVSHCHTDFDYFKKDLDNEQINKHLSVVVSTKGGDLRDILPA